MIQRVPSIPLIVNDPYFSVWVPADLVNEAGTVHWSGAKKKVSGIVHIDGVAYNWLGHSSKPAMKVTEQRILPTETMFVCEAAGIRLSVRFWAPALPDHPDLFSVPATIVDYFAEVTDEKKHRIQLTLSITSQLCCDGTDIPEMISRCFARGELHFGMVGQSRQRVLSHSGDHITMDWGYLIVASTDTIYASSDGIVCRTEGWEGSGSIRGTTILGYEDIASINYFGTPCRAWYARNGKTLIEAISEFYEKHDELLGYCGKMNDRVLKEAEELGGEDYCLIVSAAWRHTLGAHKLIATPRGEMAFLSKENDSNGCIGTVDVSYPSVPMFLKYNPELVSALCRPVLEFASLPVWDQDYAPHDVGRYPYATGQVYAAKDRLPCGATPPPYYMYPAGSDIYDLRYQMPVEECGNIIIMLEAAAAFGAKTNLIIQYKPLMEKWVLYLDQYGEDPGEQLCTDDFAGHMARNANLSAKAIVGIACWASICERTGNSGEAEKWRKRAKDMAVSWLERANTENGTALTFDGNGWSMKYNLVWDKILSLHLLPDSFYRRETQSYIPRMNQYGLPLDSRASYTKSDWEIWVASMADTPEIFRKLIAPVASYLRETETRVPFSDWYDTKTGRYVEFIARSVQGGVFMPMLRKWE